MMSWIEAARLARGNDRTDAEYVEYFKSRCKVDESGCWLFQGFLQPVTRYGELSYRKKKTKAHRAMYMAAKGPIPAGMSILHSCDVRHCLNPDHLRVGTISENKQDEIQRGRNWELSKTVCTRGHSYAEHGAKYGRNQFRSCKICTRGRSRIKAGWPEDLAYSIENIPKGQMTGLGRWERRGRNKPSGKRRGDGHADD